TTLPHICSICCVVTDDEGNIITDDNTIIQPDGWVIPAEAEAIHGISTARALAEGKPIEKVLPGVLSAMQDARYTTIYNAQFDMAMLEIEALRLGIEMPPVNQFCMMHAI